MNPFPNLTGKAVLFVDPGLGGTGLAFWEEFPTKPTAPMLSDVLSFNSVVPWTARMQKIGEALVILSTQFMAPQITVFEMPTTWLRSEASLASASRSDLSKLAILTGWLARSVKGDVCFVEPHQWKGQLSKAAVHERIRRAIKRKYPEHAADAVGMGLAAMGAL